MKLLTVSTIAIGLSLGAFAQDTSRDGYLATEMTKADMRYLIESAGYEVSDDLTEGFGLIGKTETDLIFGVQGKACSGDNQNEEPCRGVEFFTVLAGDFEADYANDVNSRWSAIKAIALESGELMMSRYLILDHGQTMENLRLNLMTVTAITEQVRDENDPQEESTERVVAEIDWGDNSGDYANDDACDDARFHEDGDDWSYQRNHVLRDANDCRAQYERGEITLFVDFGDNSGGYANDDTCDDVRFSGEGRSILTTDSHIKKDAADCIAAYQAGTIFRP